MKLCTFFILFFALRAFAITYFDTEVKSVARRGTNLDGTQTISLSLKTSSYKITPTYSEIEFQSPPKKQVPRYWQNPFNAKSDKEKAARLSALIKGINLRIAEKLIEDGFFRSMPEDWAEFTSIILAADEKYQTGFAYEVLVKNKIPNMASLGYQGYIEARGESFSKKMLCLNKKFEATVNRDFEIRINEAPLLDDETELITIVFDGIDDAIFIDSKYNEYELKNVFWNNKTKVYEFKGKRLKVKPTNNIILNVKIENWGIEFVAKDTSFNIDTRNFIKRNIMIRAYNSKKDELFNLTFNLSDSKPLTIHKILVNQKFSKEILVEYIIIYEDNPFYTEYSNKRIVLVPIFE